MSETVINPAIYNTNQFPTWCPGCGDFGIWGSIKQALASLQLGPHQVLTVFGIGCSGNMSSFLGTYGLHSLHGRSIPTAIGAKLAHHTMPIIVVGGDGDLLGEGLGHLIHAARANHDIAVILHNNEVYGLTTGQASPTAQTGVKAKATPPSGLIDQPLDPCRLVIEQEGGFVARGFAGDMPGLTKLIAAAITHPGFALVDVLQPCVTYNKAHSYDWLRQRIKTVPSPTTDKGTALGLATWTDKTINIGLLYQNNRPAFHLLLPQLRKGSLVATTGQPRPISKLLHLFE